MSMRALIIDTETTGLLKPAGTALNQQPHVIELAMLFIYGDAIATSYNQLFYSPIALPKKITEITGLTDADLEGKPTFAECYRSIQSLMTTVACDFVIAHNIAFDLGVLDCEFQRLGISVFPWPQNRICTVQEYAHLFGHRPRLDQLYERLTGEKMGDAHRAMNDVKSLYKALRQDGFFKRDLLQSPHG